MFIKTKQEAIRAIYEQSFFFDWTGFDKFRDDEEVAKYAILKNVYSYQLISKRLQEDDSIIKQALSINGLMLKSMSKKIKSNKEYVLLAVREEGTAIRYAPTWADDEEVALAAVESNHEASGYLSIRLQELIGSRNPVEVLQQTIRIKKINRNLNKNLPINRNSRILRSQKL